MSCAALSLALSAPLQAQQYSDAAPLPTWYVGPGFGVAIPDGAREAKNGANFEIVAGRVFADALSIELNYSATKFDSNLAGGPETELSAFGADLVLGLPDYGSPAFLLGVGSMSQKVGGVSQSDSYGSLGLGLYLPFSFRGELWRLEGRYQPIFADEVVEDVRVNLAVLFTFGRKPPPEPEPPPEPIVDEDGDGVADGADRCPGTPKWVRPDAFGCTPDTDADGVDDTRDECPAGAAGTPVDANGCEMTTTPVEPTAGPTGILDEDQDGVADADDTCPHTAPGTKVDARGCVEPEKMMMGNVHFDSSSARLTGDGYVMLRAIAAAMKSQPSMTLEVSGHADSTGGQEMNRDLAAERARTVYDFLTYLGIPESRLSVKSYGETQPLMDNDSKESRAYNRRVQFKRTDK